MPVLPKASLPCLEDILIRGHNAVTLHGSGTGPAGLPGRGKKKKFFLFLEEMGRTGEKKMVVCNRGSKVYKRKVK